MDLQCFNGGQLMINLTTNTSYCQCDSCHIGAQCEDLDPENEQIRFNTVGVRLVVYSIYLCCSLINNLLSLTVFLGSKQIRRTNTGIYLIIYSIISIIGSILLVLGQAIQYFKPYPFVNNEKLTAFLYCLFIRSGSQITVLSCLWVSALVGLERALIVSFNFKMNGPRQRSIRTLLPIFCLISVTSVSWLYCCCEVQMTFDNPFLRVISGWLYSAQGLGGIIYIVVTVIVLANFATRIYHYNAIEESKTKIFFILLKKHLFIFISPITYLACAIPYQVWFVIRSRANYFECDISASEYYYKVIQQTLTYVPPIFTWLIFVYPSNVYMTEFYTNTWIGKKLVRCFNSKRRTYLSRCCHATFRVETDETINEQSEHFYEENQRFKPVTEVFSRIGRRL